MAAPDLQAELPRSLKIIIGAVMFVVAVGGAAATYKHYSADKPSRLNRSFLEDGINSNYFATRAEPPKPVPKTEVKPKPKKTKVKAKSKEQIRKEQLALLKRNQIDYAEFERKRRIEEINRERRGSSKGFTRASFDAEESKVEWINTDEDFTGQGIAKRDASFPVDRSRVITTDKNISATLVEEINSELPGKIRAQIDLNVYGSVGRKVLIPAGSMAVGQYVPLGKVGDTRLKAIWTRIITPSGVNIVLVGAEMADAMGRAGITGELDSRIFERYGAAMLISSLAVAAQWSVPVNTPNEVAAVNTAGSELSRASRTVLESQIDLKPKVTIPAGSMIQITPTEDIWFKKPVSVGGDIHTEAINGR